MIKSAAAEVRSLIEALDSPSATRRESAAARLAIIGARAVGNLVLAFDAAQDRQKQRLILRVLEAAGDERALPAARKGVTAGGEVGVAAVALLRALLERGAGSTHAEALDILLAASSDAASDRRVRAAAASALTSAPPDITRALGSRFQTLGSESDVVWDEASEGCLPELAAALMDAIDVHAPRAPLPVVRRILEAVRAREEALGSTGGSDAEIRSWCAVRGALHAVLAARGSRVALYDLRESFQTAAAPLPPAFLTAAAAAGDASCLESLAIAFSRSPEGSARWRRRLAEVFQVIVRRERLTRRHTPVRRALAKAPELAQGFVTPTVRAEQLLDQ